MSMKPYRHMVGRPNMIHMSQAKGMPNTNPADDTMMELEWVGKELKRTNRRQT